ncbi:MAG TPA: phosphate signaling complex protein PhoU [Oceanithermus profundus]|uniref:Phosphate-specific transport system accessory protein PhoU n=1 Tax=Oceanithermus profundus TaxID=187137 RepID=A0A7C4V4B5_9DEIN|nr:phosphate signaling complex protein PhoU [Oceanithermus profundus]
MREALDRDLNRITERLLRMISLVREELQLATTGLTEQDGERAKAAIHLDAQVDELELEIENEVLAAIARHQPVARDLRFLATVLKALTDLERAGDYAAHVAEDALALAGEPPLKKYIVLAEMAERIEAMLDLLAKALAERDLAAAERVLKLDDDVDELYEQIVRELLTYMLEDPRTLSKALTLMRVARSYERLGDHVENIAERIFFWLTGRLEGKPEA